jgi:hypothetical protein
MYRAPTQKSATRTARSGGCATNRGVRKVGLGLASGPRAGEIGALAVCLSGQTFLFEKGKLGLLENSD